ncbi:E3 ubiquitin-protein ligase RNF34 [Chionoecetes opilio]|uniref:E3 ubiquitin-protein ligase RNF34 n=1 Tax=Chionoecetes opilio TaxID=41210 RepID=A0A8J4YSN9_CHIOP|nr:E3 ubiquitin-protein ligase RNF34 [Chionoecetes opilio]
MLGSGGVCSGPVSWWCSEVLRCSPKVAPNPAHGTTPAPMAECEHCSLRFNILRRRRECVSCRMVYCGSCLKRGSDGMRWCNKCLVLTQWPLDLSEVMALRVKDLRHFLHSRHINTATCTEKRELIDLVTRHISSQRRSTATQHPTAAPQHPTSHTPSNHGRHKPPPRTPVVPQDDGIRVRPSSNSSMGSIRVRPMDSIRVRPGHPTSHNGMDADDNSDLGIRVFPSEQGRTSQDTSSTTSPTSPGSDAGHHEGEECSQCPSNDLSASCCSLESCHDGTCSHHHHCPHHVDTSSHNSEEWVFLPDHTAPSAPPHDEGVNEGRMSGTPSPLPHTAGVAGNSTPAEQPSAPPHPPPEQQEEQSSFPAPSASSSSSASSSAPTSAVSSPEPSKGILAGIVALEDLKSEEEIRRLTVKQCKELLALHRVNYSGVREKSELLSKIKILWEDHRTSQQELENLPEELLCKICMDGVIDCVLLECGHMVACTQCGKQMSECPLCRQYVVRVVRTFRA